MTAQPDTGTAPPSAWPWPPILVVSTIAAAVILGRAYPLAWPGQNDLPARIAGHALGLAGVLLIGWAIMTLRRHDTTVRPDQATSALVTDGPYRFRRNPMYIALVFILLGVAELTHNIWFAILAFPFALLVTWLAILPEERHLEARFGDDYRAYKAATRRWI